MTYELNPRWVAYLSYDPEPTNWGFMAWIDAHWADWERENKRAPHSGKTEADHAAFTAWLLERTAPWRMAAE